MLKTIHIHAQKKFFSKLISNPIGGFVAPGARKFDGNKFSKVWKKCKFYGKITKIRDVKRLRAIPLETAISLVSNATINYALTKLKTRGGFLTPRAKKN